MEIKVTNNAVTKTTMQLITAIQNYPDGTPIDAVQGRIVSVYPSKTVQGKAGPSTVQNAELSDIGGNKVKLTVWDHPDLKPLEGGEYVLHNTGGTRFPGIKVKLGSYVAKKDGRDHKMGDTVKTFELSVNKNGSFQHIEVFNQNRPKDSPAAVVPEPRTAKEAGMATDAAKPAQAPAYINGMTIGMACNNAVKILVESGRYDPETFAKDLYAIASDIVRVSQHMEKGNLAVKKEKVTPEKSVEILEKAKLNQEADNVIDDEPPF